MRFVFLKNYYNSWQNMRLREDKRRSGSKVREMIFSRKNRGKLHGNVAFQQGRG